MDETLFTWGLLGTSLSHGATRDHSYASDVSNLLMIGKSSAVRHVNLSVNGGGSDTGVGLYESLARLRLNAIIIEYSMNDCVGSLAASQANHTAMANGIKAISPNTSVFLMTMNHLIGNSQPISVRSNLMAFYEQYRDLCAPLGAGLIDNTPAWVGATMADLPDGMHPTISAHRAKTVPGIVAALAPLVS